MTVNNLPSIRMVRSITEGYIVDCDSRMMVWLWNGKLITLFENSKRRMFGNV